MSARGFLGAGDLYISRYNPTINAFEGLKGPFECTKFEIKPNIEVKEQASRGRTTYGQVIESVSLPQPADFSIELPEVNRETLAIALMGTASTINQSAGTVAQGSPLSIVLASDIWVPLGFGNWQQDGFRVANGATVYALDTDYQVNWHLGMVRVVPGSSLATAIAASGGTPLALEVSGTYHAVGGTRIAGATATDVRARFQLDGINFADKQPVIVDVWEGVIAPDAAFDFMSNEFASIPLTGRMKTPVGRIDPYTIELRT